MSDILSVSLQDFLHGGKPDLRAEEIVGWNKKDLLRGGSGFRPLFLVV